MRPFVPKFYGMERLSDKSNKCKITIENLLYGKENGSFIDIKLGTSTLTKGSKNLIKKATRDVMDKDVTTSDFMGFTVCGMNLKDPKTGKPRDGGKYGKSKPPRTSVEAEFFLENFFKYEGLPDKDAINFVITELKKILKYF